MESWMVCFWSCVALICWDVVVVWWRGFWLCLWFKLLPDDSWCSSICSSLTFLYIFFLELLRRAARHFIKVEKNSTRVRKDPNPSTKNKHTHHTSRINLDTRHKEQEKTTSDQTFLYIDVLDSWSWCTFPVYYCIGLLFLSRTTWKVETCRNLCYPFNYFLKVCQYAISFLFTWNLGVNQNEFLRQWWTLYLCFPR